MGDKQRLFIAFDVPRTHREWLQDHVVATLRSELPDARWTDPAGQHITLKFLGWVLPDVVDGIVAACRTVAARLQPARMAITGLGAFPDTKRARVLWAGLSDGEGLSPRLAAAMDGALEPLGFETEERDFTPHLTLARFKKPARLEELFPVAADMSVLDPFDTDEITLYRSYPGRGGSRYEALEVFPLG